LTIYFPQPPHPLEEDDDETGPEEIPEEIPEDIPVDIPEIPEDIIGAGLVY